MAKDTKERILTAALEMFSQKGYYDSMEEEYSMKVLSIKNTCLRLPRQRSTLVRFGGLFIRTECKFM